MTREAIGVVVDDDSVARAAIVELLDSAGYSTREFGSAEEFLDAHDPDVPSCLILDFDLPGMDGIELLEDLADRGTLVPLILLTGHGTEEVKRRALELGVLAYFEKPYRADFLLHAVQRAADCLG